MSVVPFRNEKTTSGGSQQINNGLSGKLLFLRLSTDISGFLLLNGKHPVTVSSRGPLGFHYELLGHVILLGQVVQSPIKLSQG